MGKSIRILLTEMQAELNDIDGDGALVPIKQSAMQGLGLVKDAAEWIGENVMKDMNLIGASAHHFLMLNGIVFGGFYMAKSAALASAKREGDPAFYDAKITTATFYAEHLAPRAISHHQSVKASIETLMNLSEEQF